MLEKSEICDIYIDNNCDSNSDVHIQNLLQ